MSNEVQVSQQSQDQSIRDVYAGAAVISKLEKMMDRVTEKECTVATVQAAVNCVEAINSLLRTHLEQQRLNIEKEKMRRMYPQVQRKA